VSPELLCHLPHLNEEEEDEEIAAEKEEEIRRLE
jgi:hypothetical protein